MRRTEVEGGGHPAASASLPASSGSQAPAAPAAPIVKKELKEELHKGADPEPDAESTRTGSSVVAFEKASTCSGTTLHLPSPPASIADNDDADHDEPVPKGKIGTPKGPKADERTIAEGRKLLGEEDAKTVTPWKLRRDQA